MSMVFDSLVYNFLLVLDCIWLIVWWKGEVHVSDFLNLRALVFNVFLRVLVVQVDNLLLVLEDSTLCMSVNVANEVKLIL